MNLFFIFSIYFFARGVFALFGQPLFYTKRSLANITEEQLPIYLKEVGVLDMIVGGLFFLKALLDILMPQSMAVTIGFLALVMICVVKLARCNEKYIKK
ncbi:hypothetical protein [Chakrabartyella piscis]|uniref:hypothetical protein n=1 Tax=Chakrabartyella piscis TaxID=2918914 RepID=UPI002958BF79|nr:hypothetical protein [Chakrabartyella piscis]